MALTLLVVLTTAHLEDLHLVVTTLGDNGSFDGSPAHQRRTKLDLVACAHCEHLVERDFSANVSRYLFYFQFFASSNLVLLAAGFTTAYIVEPLDVYKTPNARPVPLHHATVIDRSRCRPAGWLSPAGARSAHDLRTNQPHPGARPGSAPDRTRCSAVTEVARPAQLAKATGELRILYENEEKRKENRYIARQRRSTHMAPPARLCRSGPDRPAGSRPARRRRTIRRRGGCGGSCRGTCPCADYSHARRRPRTRAASAAQQPGHPPGDGHTYTPIAYNRPVLRNGDHLVPVFRHCPACPGRCRHARRRRSHPPAPRLGSAPDRTDRRIHHRRGRQAPAPGDPAAGRAGPGLRWPPPP